MITHKVEIKQVIYTHGERDALAAAAAAIKVLGQASVHAIEIKVTLGETADEDDDDD